MIQVIIAVEAAQRYFFLLTKNEVNSAKDMPNFISFHFFMLSSVVCNRSSSTM